MTHSCCVDSLGIVVYHPRQAEVRHFTYEIAVDKDVSSGQISMDVSHIGEISHSRRYAPQHPHQLDDCELTVVFLHKHSGTHTQTQTERERENTRAGSVVFTDHEGNVGHKQSTAAALAQDL